MVDAHKFLTLRFGHFQQGYRGLMNKNRKGFTTYILLYFATLPVGVGLLFVIVRNLIVFIGMITNTSGFESATIKIWDPFIYGVKFGLWADLFGVFIFIPFAWFLWPKIVKRNIDEYVTRD